MSHNLWTDANVPLSNYFLFSGQAGSNGIPPASASNLNNFHTYGINIQNDFITFYMDRVVTEQFPTSFPLTPMYLILSCGMGGLAGAVANPSLLPAHVFLQGVNVWSNTPF
jgi:beta-glucanase (GH16 family)